MLHNVGLCLLLVAGCKKAPADSQLESKPASPDSKLELIERIDAALRAGSEEDFAKLVLKADRIETLCASLEPTVRAELVSEARDDRERALKYFRSCLALVDWSKTRRLALNYGSREWPVREGCNREWQRLEGSELYYAVGERTYKVSVQGPYRDGARFGLLNKIRCFAKDPRHKASDMEGMRSRCRAPGWPVVSQGGASSELDCD